MALVVLVKRTGYRLQLGRKRLLLLDEIVDFFAKLSFAVYADSLSRANINGHHASPRIRFIAGVANFLLCAVGNCCAGAKVLDFSGGSGQSLRPGKP